MLTFQFYLCLARLLIVLYTFHGRRTDGGELLNISSNGSLTIEYIAYCTVQNSFGLCTEVTSLPNSSILRPIISLTLFIIRL